MQSGIAVDSDLVQNVREFVSDPSLYGLAATIKSEKIVFSCVASSPAELVEKLNAREAQYVIIKDPVSVAKSAPSSFPLEPLFAVAFIPLDAPVRSKTIFASSFLTFQRDLNSAASVSFVETPFLSKLDELTDRGWTLYAAHKAAPPPLSEKERTLQELDAATIGSSAARMPLAGMARMMGGYGAAGTAVAGNGSWNGSKQADKVGNPLHSQAESKLREFASGNPGDWVLLKIDHTEKVILVDSSFEQSHTPATVAAILSDNEPQYLFFRYHHENNTESSQNDVSVVSISCVPTASAVRNRMLHSCAKVGLNRFVETEIGIPIARKIETSDRQEATEILREHFAGPPPSKKAPPKPMPKPSGLASPASGAASSGDDEKIESQDDPDTDAVLVSRVPRAGASSGYGPGVSSASGGGQPGMSPLADVLMGRRPKGPGRR